MPTFVKTETLSTGATQKTIAYKIGENDDDILEVKANESAFAGLIVVNVEDYSGVYKDPPAPTTSEVVNNVIDAA